MKRAVRIIGGLYKGKKLPFKEADGLRPTPNRVRETLFNWLMHDIRGSRCLDAFAGSGALGFEAFSRGANSVTLIEQSPLAFIELQKIIKQFLSIDKGCITDMSPTQQPSTKLPQLNLIKMDALMYLHNNTHPFDIVFLDPPFSQEYLDQCLNELSKENNLIKNGLVYIESFKPIILDNKEWQQLKLAQAGQVRYGLFRKL